MPGWAVGLGFVAAAVSGGLGFGYGQAVAAGRAEEMVRASGLVLGASGFVGVLGVALFLGAVFQRSQGAGRAVARVIGGVMSTLLIAAAIAGVVWLHPLLLRQ